MRAPLLLLVLLAFITATLAFRLKDRSTPVTAQRNIRLQVIRCSPDWSAVKNFLEESDIPVFPGAGNYKWKISTTNDSAQFYFNQGINMYYGFHIIESMASFKKASRFDPDCAMLYWAQALAYGPNINDMGYAASPEALAAAGKATELSSSCTPVEKALIQAMHVRYTADSADTDRKKLNEAYTASMKDAYTRFPGSSDIATLYADALMLEHPWDLWTPDGQPKAWTPRIMEVLEKILKTSPENPGANHYYIHVMEPSPYAYKALPSAERLGNLTPGLSHMVHMPSHIYLRTGDYEKGYAVNEQAVNRYRESISLFPAVVNADFLYSLHNLHMQINHAYMSGRHKVADSLSAIVMEQIPESYLGLPGGAGNLLQYIAMTAVFTDIRFGNWPSLLQRKEPAAEHVYARIIWLMGKGMALAKTGNTSEAAKLLDRLKLLSKDTVLEAPIPPFSPATEGTKIAAYMLEGTIAMENNKVKDAVGLFNAAVKTEAAMVYNEPRDWIISPRHFLAKALFMAGSYAEAEKILQDDLKVNKDNGWALTGMWKIKEALHKQKEAALWKSKAATVFTHAEKRPDGTVF